MGALWVRRELLATGCESTFAGYFTFARIDSRGNRTLRDRCAGGSRSRTTTGRRSSGMARAIGWLTMYVGLDVRDRAARRWPAAADLLAAIEGVELLTPRDRMAGLVTFRIAGWEPQAALDELGRADLRDRPDAAAVNALRISVGFWTTEDELDRFIDGVGLLAAHTPETMPPRRTLTIVGQD